MVHGSVKGCLRWRNDKAITNTNFKRAINQIRMNVASGSGIAMPASNTREKWEEGAEVETEGASGKWWWAKITASCHDDGTYNVAIDDDQPGGDQKWKHVRPVHLRSRVQLKRPQGIAIRPDTGIPRWGGDNGAAFKKLLGRWMDGDSSDSESECSSGDEARAAGEAHKYSKDSDHYQSKPGGSRVLRGKGSRGKARAGGASDKAGTARRGRRRRRKKKSGQLHKKARRRNADPLFKRRNADLWITRAQDAGKRDAGSKHQENSSEQHQTDYDAKMSKGGKSTDYKRGHPQGEVTTRRCNLGKIKKISWSKRAEAVLHRKASCEQDSSDGHHEGNETKQHTSGGTSKSKRSQTRTDLHAQNKYVSKS